MSDGHSLLKEHLDKIDCLRNRGDLVGAMSCCVEAIRTQPIEVLKGRLIREFHDLVKPPIRLTPGEYEAVLPAVQGLPEALKRRLRDPAVLSPEIGTVNGLFVTNAESSAPVGCLHHITAYGMKTMTPKARNVCLINASRDPMTASAVWTAGLAVANVLEASGLNETGQQVYQAWDVTVWINQGRGEYDGDSLGLPVALAILSCLAQVPIPSELAFTGAVSPQGDVEPVGGIQEKLKAANLRRLKTVFIPTGNLSDVPETAKVIVHPVARLSELLEELFPKEALATAIALLNKECVPATRAVEAFDQARRGGVPVLLTFIGNRDPYGDEKYVNIAQGPVVTAVRHVQPRAVGLLYTPGRAIETNARKTEAELKAMTPSLYVKPLPLPINDPTDYDDIFEAMDGQLKGFLLLAATELACPLEKLEPYVALSSGTPQMHAVWLEFLRRGPLKGAHAIQVREPEFLAPGDLAVREVSSRHLGIGTQALQN